MRYQIQVSIKHKDADDFSDWYPVKEIRNTFRKKSEAIEEFEFWYRKYYKLDKVIRAGYFFQTDYDLIFSLNLNKDIEDWKRSYPQQGIERWRLFDLKISREVKKGEIRWQLKK